MISSFPMNFKMANPPQDLKFHGRPGNTREKLRTPKTANLPFQKKWQDAVWNLRYGTPVCRWDVSREDRFRDPNVTFPREPKRIAKKNGPHSAQEWSGPPLPGPQTCRIDIPLPYHELGRLISTPTTIREPIKRLDSLVLQLCRFDNASIRHFLVPFYRVKWGP